MTRRDEYIAQRILWDEESIAVLKYDPNFHPKDIVRYFREPWNQLREPERFESDHRLEYVTKPVHMPTISGYAAEIGVSRHTIRDWANANEEFDQAIEVCKAIQEDINVRLSLLKAYDSRFAIMLAKNEHDWQDKVETTHKGDIVLQFDEQDKKA